MSMKRLCYTEYHPTSLEVKALAEMGGRYIRELAEVTSEFGPMHRLPLVEKARFHDAVRKVYKDATRAYKKKAGIR